MYMYHICIDNLFAPAESITQSNFPDISWIYCTVNSILLAP